MPKLSQEKLSKFNTDMDERLGNLYEQLSHEDELVDEYIEPEERYQLEDKIAEGGLKEIYKAFDVKSSRYVAMAFIRESLKNDELTELFKRESKITALLEHSNIIPVYDIGWMKRPFFTMKLIQGQDLNQYLENLKPGERRNQLLRIFVKICDAIAYAHSRGVVHLDLKPGNIYIDKFGEVFVYDWGMARRLFIPENDMNFLSPDPVDIPDLISGTPAFMAPEQLDPQHKTVDERTDIFSLGGLLYTILTGAVPYNIESFDSKRDLTPPKDRAPEANIPESLSAVCLKSMKTSLDERYQNARDLRHEIELYLDGFATEAENASFLKSFKLMIVRHKRICVSIFVSVFIIVSLVSIFVTELKVSENKTKAALEDTTYARNLAEVAQKTAEKNQHRAEDALREAQENFDMYLDEKKERELLKELSISNINSVFTEKWTYTRTLNQLNLALAAAPNDIKVISNKIIFLIFYEKNEEAYQLYKKSQLTKQSYIKNILEEYKKYRRDDTHYHRQGYLEDNDFVKYVSTIGNTSAYWVARRIIHHRLSRPQTKERRLTLIHEILKQTNLNQKHWDIKFSTQEGSVYTHFDLSGHKDLRNLIGLSGLKIGTLDLSHCGNIRLEDLNSSYVRKIIINGCELDSLKALQHLPGLEEIVLHRNQISKEDADQLSKSFLVIKLTYVD